MRQTSESVRGTVEFVSDYAVSPVVKTYGTVAGARQFIAVMSRLGRSRKGPIGVAMRFLIGIAIGFGVGFAGAVLFAPDRKKGERIQWPAGAVDSGPPAFDTDHNIMASVRRTLRSVQDQVNEALDEAKKAQAETESEMRAHYERKVRHAVEEPPKLEEKAKGKAKGKKDK